MKDVAASAMWSEVQEGIETEIEVVQEGTEAEAEAEAVNEQQIRIEPWRTFRARKLSQSQATF